MSKWSDEQAMEAWREVAQLDDPSNATLRLGRAILDLRERAENAEHMLKYAGVCELAAGNVNVASYMNEWEGRTTKAEQRCAEFVAAEKEVSDAYLRVRALLNAYDTAPGGADRYAVTEAAISALQQRCAALEAAIVSVQWGGRIGQEGEYRACPSCESIAPDDPDFGGGDHLPGCALNSALSGDTSALREMLEKAAYEGQRSCTCTDDFYKEQESAASIAKRVMEGK